MHLEGKEPPQQFYDQPEIPEHLLFYWEAFGDLGTERQAGMGVGPIPRSKIREFAASELGLQDDQSTKFFEVIVGLDSEYVAMANSPKDMAADKMKSVVAPTDVKAVSGLFDRLSKSPKHSDRPARRKSTT